MDKPGVACPICGSFSVLEPGGVRCLLQGHLLTFRRVLPKSTTGHDWRARLRMRALDRAFISPGRGASIPLDLLESLEAGPGRNGHDGDE